jgi:hypothetical protein
LRAVQAAPLGHGLTSCSCAACPCIPRSRPPQPIPCHAKHLHLHPPRTLRQLSATEEHAARQAARLRGRPRVQRVRVAPLVRLTVQHRAKLRRAAAATDAAAALELRQQLRRDCLVAGLGPRVAPARRSLRMCLYKLLGNSSSAKTPRQHQPWSAAVLEGQAVGQQGGTSLAHEAATANRTARACASVCGVHLWSTRSFPGSSTSSGRARTCTTQHSPRPAGRPRPGLLESLASHAIGDSALAPAGLITSAPSNGRPELRSEEWGGRRISPHCTNCAPAWRHLP